MRTGALGAVNAVDIVGPSYYSGVSLGLRRIDRHCHRFGRYGWGREGEEGGGIDDVDETVVKGSIVFSKMTSGKQQQRVSCRILCARMPAPCVFC